MIFGKYGEMILANMEKNYPYRKQELELTGELDIKIFERERYILELKEKVEKQIKEKNKAPDTHEISVLAKYQQMIDGLVDEALMKEILQYTIGLYQTFETKKMLRTTALSHLHTCFIILIIHPIFSIST